MVRRVNAIVRLTARLLVLLSSGLALLVVAILAATQFQPTRKALLETGLELLNESLQGRVTVGAITGNMLTGLVIDDATVTADGTTLFTAPRIELRYQLSPIFRDKVVGARATLINPAIHLVRNARDGAWNFARLTKPSTSVDTGGAPFPYTIDVTALEIRDGTVRLDDNAVPDRRTRSVDYSHLDLRRFNLSAIARIESNRTRAVVQHLSFDLPRNDIRIIDLSVGLDLDTTGATIDDLRLETTRTLLSLTATIDSINIPGGDTDPSRWKTTPVALALKAPRVSTEEMQSFLPALSFLGGTPAIELEAKGTYGDVVIDRLHVFTGETTINIAGRMRNLQRPDDLQFDARLTDSRISPADVNASLPGIPLPDLTPYGLVDIPLAEYRGGIRRFHGAVQGRTAAGSVRGAGLLDLDGPELRYEADVTLGSFDLSRIMNDASYRSDFNGRLIVSGSGTSPASIDARFLVVSNGSTVMGRSYRRLVAQGTYGQGGVAAIDTLVAVLGTGGAMSGEESAATIDEFIERNPIARLARRAGSEIDEVMFASGASVALGGRIDFRNQAVPEYDVNVRGHRIGAADLIADGAADRFSFSGSIKGKGLDVDKLEGVAQVDVTEALMADGRQTEAFTVDAELAGDPTTDRRFTLRSSMVDISIGGEWRFTSIGQSLARAMDGLINYAQRKASYRDGDGIGLGMNGGGSNERVAATYELTIRDLRPLEPFLGGMKMDAAGSLKGTISGTSRLLSLDAAGDLDHISIVTQDIDLRIGRTRLKTLELRNIAPGYIDDITGIEIEVAIDSPFVFNGATYSVPSFRTTLEEGVFTFRGSGGVPGELLAVVSGVVDTRDQTGYKVAIDNLNVFTSSEQNWRNVGTIRGMVNEHDIRIDTLRLRRKMAEVVSISGRFIEFDRLQDVHIDVIGATIAGLTEFTKTTPFYDELKQGTGTFRTLAIDIEGDLEDPRIDMRLDLDSLSFAHTPPVGVTLDLSYADRNLTGVGTITDILHWVNGAPRVAAKIEARTLPIDLALARRTKRLLNDRPVDVVAGTDSLPLSIVSPFLSGARVSAGTLTTGFTISGELPDITYRGAGVIDNGRILLESTNITYMADGALEFTERRLTVKRLDVRNLPVDLRDGRASITGYVNLVAFTPKDFMLTMESRRLLVLSDATQAVNNQIYGDLVVAIPNLTFSGTSFAAPRVGGTVIVTEAALKADPVATQTTINEINYVDYAEWQRQRESGTYGPQIPDSNQNRRGDGSSDDADQDSTPRGVQKGFYDRLEIRNLIVNIREGVSLTINFSPFQQLRALLKTPPEKQGLILNKKPSEDLKAVEKIEVTQGSKFVFFKPFEVTGNDLDFNGPISNPRLNITAEYTGRQLQAGTDLTKEYIVTVTITGTVAKPQIDLHYQFVGEASTALPTDRETQQRNALALLLFGRTIEQLGSTSLGEQVGNVAGTFGESGLSIVSSTLSNLLAGGTDFIRSVDISGSATDIGQARVNLISQFDKIVVRAGGRISNPAADGTVTVDLPLSMFLDGDVFQKFVVQLERAAESSQNSGATSTSSEDQETYRLRLQFRLVW